MRPTLRVWAAAAVAAAFALPAASIPARAQESDVMDAARRVIAYERDSSDVMSNLEYLSDIIGPRLTGSDRLRKASEWTLAKMKEYGLDNVHLETYTIPEGWQRGSVEMRVVEPNGLPIAAAQMAWTPPTHGRVTGPVVFFNPSREEDLAPFHGKLKGAIILASPDAPVHGMAAELPPIPALSTPASAAPPLPPSRRNMDYHSFLAFQKQLGEFLRSEGAIAVLRDAGKPYDLLNMTGSWRNPSALPVLFITHEGSSMLHRLLKRGGPVTMELKADCKLVKGPVTVANTVGEIRGSEKPDEAVILGGHLDSWDLATGSTDNGTGAMAALEAAHLLKAADVHPRRTIRFILFTGEEEGLIGSSEYVKAHRAEMPSVDVVFIDDTGTGRVKGLWLQDRAEDKPVLEQQFSMLSDLGLLTDTPNLIPGKMNGTDHASFDDAGVPAFAFNQDGVDYGMTHHSQADTFDKVVPEDLKQCCCVLAIMGYSAAQMAERYPRSETAAAR